MSYLTEYVEDVANLSGLSLDNEQETVLVQMYAILGLALGPYVDEECVHDAWSIWTEFTRDNPNHRSLIPIDQLADDVVELDKDRSYVDAINKAIIQFRTREELGEG